ncbi:MAG: hypothetical protein ACTHKH_11370 [Trinickia sp.]
MNNGYDELKQRTPQRSKSGRNPPAQQQSGNAPAQSHGQRPSDVLDLLDRNLTPSGIIEQTTQPPGATDSYAWNRVKNNEFRGRVCSIPQNYRLSQQPIHNNDQSATSGADYGNRPRANSSQIQQFFRNTPFGSTTSIAPSESKESLKSESSIRIKRSRGSRKNLNVGYLADTGSPARSRANTNTMIADVKQLDLREDSDIEIQRKSSGSSSDSPDSKKKNQRQSIDSIAPSSYGLIHTLGMTKYDPHTGDGAYSRWFHEYFMRVRGSEGCEAVARITYDGAKNILEDNLPQYFNPEFTKKFRETITSGKFKNATAIILNWHIRITGHVNGWTGRGINRTLVDDLQIICNDLHKKLHIIYTVHEIAKLLNPESSTRKSSKSDDSMGLISRLLSPSGIISLNPDVSKEIGRLVPNAEHFSSRVPAVMDPLYAPVVLDHGIEPFVRGMESSEELRQLYLAFLQTQARRKSTYFERQDEEGIVIFGMISGRHGLSIETLRKLSTKMNESGLDSGFKILIAGSRTSEKIVREIENEAKADKRFKCISPIEQLESLTKSRYAISFDKLGYRDNASSMISLDRAGFLLFSRSKKPDKPELESNDELTSRAVETIIQCELDDLHYLRCLAQNRRRAQAADPVPTGQGLGEFFRRIAGGAAPDRLSTPDTAVRRPGSQSGCGNGRGSYAAGSAHSQRQAEPARRRRFALSDLPEQRQWHMGLRPFLQIVNAEMGLASPDGNNCLLDSVYQLANNRRRTPGHEPEGLSDSVRQLRRTLEEIGDADPRDLLDAEGSRGLGVTLARNFEVRIQFIESTEDDRLIFHPIYGDRTHRLVHILHTVDHFQPLWPRN